MGMIATIRNVGKTRTFPTCLGAVTIPHLKEVEIPNEDAAKEILRSPLLIVKWRSEGDDQRAAPGQQPMPQIDYSKYRAQELRSIAASLKVPGFFTMKKKDLIQILSEEQNAK